MRSLLAMAVVAVSLSACVSSEDGRGRDLALDSTRCANLGFAVGSSEMADCMDTAAATRAVDQDRNARALAATNARIQADDERRSADFQAKMRSGTPASSPYPMPSAAGIPGMQCSGSGDDQACNAQ